ncbi:MAG: hypothetical protein ACE5FT_00190 [Candidatus Nanoarchaeia archaeon]
MSARDTPSSPGQVFVDPGIMDPLPEPVLDPREVFKVSSSRRLSSVPPRSLSSINKTKFYGELGRKFSDSSAGISVLKEILNTIMWRAPSLSSDREASKISIELGKFSREFISDVLNFSGAGTYDKTVEGLEAEIADFTEKLRLEEKLAGSLDPEKVEAEVLERTMLSVDDKRALYIGKKRRRMKKLRTAKLARKSSAAYAYSKMQDELKGIAEKTKEVLTYRGRVALKVKELVRIEKELARSQDEAVTQKWTERRADVGGDIGRNLTRFTKTLGQVLEQRLKHRTLRGHYDSALLTVAHFALNPKNQTEDITDKFTDPNHLSGNTEQVVKFLLMCIKNHTESKGSMHYSPETASKLYKALGIILRSVAKGKKMRHKKVIEELDTELYASVRGIDLEVLRAIAEEASDLQKNALPTDVGQIPEYELLELSAGFAHQIVEYDRTVTTFRPPLLLEIPENAEYKPSRKVALKTNMTELSDEELKVQEEKMRRQIYDGFIASVGEKLEREIEVEALYESFDDYETGDMQWILNDVEKRLNRPDVIIKSTGIQESISELHRRKIYHNEVAKMAQDLIRNASISAFQAYAGALLYAIDSIDGADIIPECAAAAQSLLPDRAEALEDMMYTRDFIVDKAKQRLKRGDIYHHNDNLVVTLKSSTKKSPAFMYLMWERVAKIARDKERPFAEMFALGAQIHAAGLAGEVVKISDLYSKFKMNAIFFRTRNKQYSGAPPKMAEVGSYKNYEEFFRTVLPPKYAEDLIETF